MTTGSKPRKSQLKGYDRVMGHYRLTRDQDGRRGGSRRGLRVIEIMIWP
jgi:hypothetical protein